MIIPGQNIKTDSKIILNKFESKIAKIMGKKRFEQNRKHGIRNEKIGPQSNAFTDINSSGGEIGFGKLFNLFPDLDFDHRPIHDYMLHTWTVDVKTTNYNNGRLLARLKCAKKPCDLYALMTGTLPTYIFRGFIVKEEFLIDRCIGDVGHGKTYIALQSALSDLDTLLRNVKLK